MTKTEMILLDGMIELSYKDEKAFIKLCEYDAARTGRKLEDVVLINTWLRSGNAPLVKEAVKFSSKLQ